MTTAELIAEQIAYLTKIAAERAGDRPADAAVPAAWHRRELDRVAVELAAAERIRELQIAAGHAAAEAHPPTPPADVQLLCGCCTRRITDGRVAVTGKIQYCRHCIDLPEATKALARRFRSWLRAEAPQRLDDLTNDDLFRLRHAVCDVGPRNAFHDRELVQAALLRRPHRGAVPSGDSNDDD